MAIGDTLYIYLCRNCQTLAAHTVKVSSPLKCPNDRIHMDFKYEMPVVTEGQREIAKLGLVFNPFVARVPPEQREKRCDRQGCRVYKRKAEMLNGRFCSEACGAADSLEVAAALERNEQLYQEMPWLRPKAKEIA